jgi:hypothetical protein
MSDQLAYEPLRIDGRLVAPQRDDAQLHPR